MKTGVKEFKREYKHIDIDQIEVRRLNVVQSEDCSCIIYSKTL